MFSQTRRVDAPSPGYYVIRLTKGGVLLPARIRLDFGAWSASVAGVPCGIAHEDPFQATGLQRIHEYGEIVGEPEYYRRLQNLPAVDWRKPVDLVSEAPLF